MQSECNPPMCLPVSDTQEMFYGWGSITCWHEKEKAEPLVMDDHLETALCPLHPLPLSPCLFIMHHCSSIHLRLPGNSQFPASLPLNFPDVLIYFPFSETAFLSQRCCHLNGWTIHISVGDSKRENSSLKTLYRTSCMLTLLHSVCILVQVRWVCDIGEKEQDFAALPFYFGL